jgi:tRNA modification GTPase
VDTAGLREAGDIIEQEGIRRSRESVAKAELILHVFDASEAFTPEDSNYLQQFAQKKRIIVRNKMDLPSRLDLPPTPRSRVVEVCSLTGQGMETMKDAIKDLVWTGEINAGMLQVMINSRHQDALRRAREAGVRTLEALREDLPLDLVAVDLRISVKAVGEVVGKTTTEDLLDSIFSQFCIGK